MHENTPQINGNPLKSKPLPEMFSRYVPKYYALIIRPTLVDIKIKHVFIVSSTRRIYTAYYTQNTKIA